MKRMPALQALRFPGRLPNPRAAVPSSLARLATSSHSIPVESPVDTRPSPAAAALGQRTRIPPLPTQQPPSNEPQPLEFLNVSPTLYQLRLGLWQFRRDDVWTIYQRLVAQDQLCYLSARDHFNILHSITLKGYLWFNDSTAKHEMSKIMYVWNQIQACGLTPTVREYNHMLEFLARAQDIRRLEAVFQQMKTAGVTPNFFSYNMVMYGYAKAGEASQTLGILESIRAKFDIRSGFTRSALIELYGALGQSNEALAIYHETKVEQGGSGGWQHGHNIHSRNALLRALGRSRRLETMHQIFVEAWRNHGIMGLDQTSFEIMIQWHSTHNALETAQNYFELMQAPPFNFKPTARTFKYLLPPAVCAGDPVFAVKHFRTMTDKFQIPPLGYMLRHMVDYYEQEVLAESKQNDSEVERAYTTVEPAV
ncbi:hypothetical protein H4R33_001998 [Dimargaris cristalligena]|uniref:Pentacotripeptide-repeat region of PRORP domain-containing protein n=1 Tax=Dimargaris cristalligena TaxID=215637 RepID=A0A4P9ZVX4_9FUNG|nr:hypothetical protein H4R33_001998 [Dimargaris cristalligena]RKP37743.1 hypothetical protein BJ085DRAFT_30529 [Dimargaris cristalligena]|eukprot:RKP37743.1 hypothetical protein BJ085DRAFT_30529 [Dimargaris cristalligena]